MARPLSADLYVLDKGKPACCIWALTPELFANWKEPHEDKTYNESNIIQEIDITSDGVVNYTIAPKHPHCPCCLLDCVELKQKIETIKGVNGVICTVVGIPGAEKWMRSING